jgi:hypothetical protein
MMDKVIIIDASQLLTIMRRTGVDGLSALHKRGEYFFFSDDLRAELIAANEWDSKNGLRFQAWREEQRVNGRLIEMKERVTSEEYKIYDLGKRGTSRGGKELSDMSIRKFMLQNKDRFTFEVISRDLELLNHQVDDPAHPLYGLQFDRLSTRSALTWLATHPDVPHNPERLQSLLQAIHKGKFDLSKDRGIATHELERESYRLPDTYEDAVIERARRAETDPRRRSDIRGFSGQADGQLGRAPVDPGAGVPFSSSGAPLDGLSGGQLEPNAGINGKAKGSLTEGPSIGRRFMNLARNGAQVALLGIAAVPVFSMVQARAAERNIPFDQAARELGIEFGEDELAEVGADAAITAIPVAGWLKKAWDVLGNVDDIVAVTQLYGAAYPDNETIQQLAGIADAVEGTAAFETYVEGRDALTGAVGGAIDWVFSTSTGEEEQAKALGDLRELVEIGGDAAGDALKAGATQEQVADALTTAVQARATAQVTSGKPLAEEEAPLSAPVPKADQLSPETALPGGGTAPMSGVPTLPGAQQILPSSLELGLEPALEPGLDPASGPETAPAAAGQIPDRATASGLEADSDRFLRKTSYRTFRKIGRTPEEEQQGQDELWEEFEQGYLEMNGREQAAELLAARRFSRRWALSDYAEDADGLMMKYPMERVYPNIEEIGYSYVDEDVKAALSRQGIRAKKWYLTPNDKTGGDWEQGWMDRDGYGPRMTLAYDDEAGQRHRLSDSYQVNVRGAAIKLKQQQLKAERMKAGQTVPEPASDPRVTMPEKAPVSLQSPTLVQAPVPRPKPDVRPPV